ncbi:LamG domain-containing protein [Streptomyces sp. NPDC001843]|uniref:LamG domain-containing protein n=1 Tax=Streptomyces sp. NPDC001843 TaxID=3364617 RepID=UPI0036C0EA6D
MEVTADRTEYSTTTANPDGSFTLTQSTTPQRVREKDGNWGAVDPVLVRRADGRIAPRGAVVDLSFSGGGPGSDMIRLGKDGRSVTLGWSDTLPEPKLDGATATYPDVFDGVDLQLTATAEGYREVLVVKTAQAAENPALEQVKLAASGDGLAVVPGAGGGLRAVDEDGNAVFRGPAGQMWDSAGDTGSGSQTQLVRSTGTATANTGGASADPSQPGEGDATATLPVKVDDDAVAVHPDLGLLRGKDTVYPVYIDPPVGLGTTKRTKISSDGDKFWMFDGAKGVGRCGNADGYYCGGGYVDRMYFEFAPTHMAGKHILDATFRAKETWSFNCDAHTVDLVRTDNISEGTRWPGPKQLDLMGDQKVAAGRGNLCHPDQPAKWVEFNDSAGEKDENLTSTVRSFAAGKFSRLTLMLRAHDEGDTRAWKRFDDSAELQVVYGYKPGVPGDVGVIPGTGKTAYCNKSASKPLTATVTIPKVHAVVKTQVKPRTGENAASLQAEYVVERGDDAAWHEVWSGHAPDKGWDGYGEPENLTMSPRAEGGLYRYRARTQSHWSYDGKSGDLWSPYSSWCYFKIDSQAPKAPRITVGSPYTACDAVCEGKGGPGVPGSFRFQPNATDVDSKGHTDITAYRYRLLTTKAREVKGDTKDGVKVSDVTPPLGGTQVLSVVAKDVHDRWGTPAEFAFKVAPAQGEVGRWHFDDAAPGSGKTLAKDTATEGTRHDATLHTAGAGWSGLARRGNADYSLWLNDGSDDNQRAGYAATETAAVNTKDSFTVSAWVFQTDASQNQVVLSAPGTSGSAFALYYSASLKQWVFNRTAGDVKDKAVYVRSVADAGPPPLRVWTHLAAVFDTQGDADKTNDTIQLFVNGRPQGKPVVLNEVSAAYQPWTSTQGLQFGRSLVGGDFGEYFRGRIDEAAVWQYALQPEQIAQEATLKENGTAASELVADWDATSSTGSQVKEMSPYGIPALTVSPKGATLGADEEHDTALVLDGSSGYASAAGPVTDETGSFTASARVRLDGEGLTAKPVGYQAQVAGQQASGGESSWALWVVKTDTSSYQWKCTRTAVGADGKVTQSAAVAATDLAELNTTVDVTCVYDAQWTDPADEASDEDTQMGRLHLFVGGDEQVTDDGFTFSAVQHGNGAISAGRGSAGGTTGYYLPGSLASLRVWTGALDEQQIRSQVMDTPDSD